MCLYPLDFPGSSFHHMMDCCHPHSFLWLGVSDIDPVVKTLVSVMFLFKSLPVAILEMVVTSLIQATWPCFRAAGVCDMIFMSRFSYLGLSGTSHIVLIYHNHL